MRSRWMIIVTILTVFASNFLLAPVSANQMGDPQSDAAAAAFLTILLIIYAYSQLNKDEQNLALVPLSILVKSLLQKIPDQPTVQTPVQTPAATSSTTKRVPCQACSGSRWGPGKVDCTKCVDGGVPMGTLQGGGMCPECNGERWITCTTCNGSGFVNQQISK